MNCDCWELNITGTLLSHLTETQLCRDLWAVGGAVWQWVKGEGPGDERKLLKVAGMSAFA